MRTSAILLIVLALGLIVTGCAKTVPPTDNPIVTDTMATDIVLDDTTANPDIGALDDTAVSDGLPQ